MGMQISPRIEKKKEERCRHLAAQSHIKARGGAEVAVCPKSVVCNGQRDLEEAMARANYVYVSSPEVSSTGSNDLEIDSGLIPHMTTIFEPGKEVFALTDVEGL